MVITAADGILWRVSSLLLLCCSFKLTVAIGLGQFHSKASLSSQAVRHHVACFHKCDEVESSSIFLNMQSISSNTKHHASSALNSYIKKIEFFLFR